MNDDGLAKSLTKSWTGLTPGLAEYARAGHGDIAKNVLSQMMPRSRALITSIGQRTTVDVLEALRPKMDFGFGIGGTRTAEMLGFTAGSVSAMVAHAVKPAGIGSVMAAYGDAFAVGSMWQRVSEAARGAIFPEDMLARIREIQYPENLHDVEDLSFEKVQQVVLHDGIALYGLPRTSIAQAILDSETTSQRREIVGRRWNAISQDCRELLGECEDPELKSFVTVAEQALDALDAGHSAAAQALTGSLIESTLIEFFGEVRYDFMPNKRGRSPEGTHEVINVRQRIAFAPITPTYQLFHADKKDTIPTSFSRHGIAHTVHPRQYSRRSAVQGLMFACSLLYRIYEEIAAQPNSDHWLTQRRDSQSSGGGPLPSPDSAARTRCRSTARRASPSPRSSHHGRYSR